MSAVSPPRPGRRQAAPPVVNPYPLRYPDSSSRTVMTRRAWWLVVLNFLVPGSAQALAGNRRLGRFGLGATLLLWALALICAVIALIDLGTFVDLATGAWVPGWLALLRPVPMLIVQGILFLYAGLWIVLTIDTLRLVRLVKVRPWARLATSIVAIGALVLSSAGAV